MQTAWDWSDPSVPLQFSGTRSAENRHFLTRLLGDIWLAEALGAPRSSHPLIMAWKSGGPDPLLSLNALAEDLRLLEQVSGLEPVLHDLKQPKGYEPTRHMLRSAALFARAGNPILRLYPPSRSSVTDFDVQLGGTAVPVEAKLLTESETSKRFRSYSSKLRARILKEILAEERIYPPLHVVLKNSDELPAESDVLAGVRFALNNFSGTRRELAKGPKLNVAIAPPPALGSGHYINLMISAPRSLSESRRVRNSVETSNKQLKKQTEGKRPGLLCLGITLHQDPHLIADILNGKFKGSQLRSISAVLLQQTALPDGPAPGPRPWIDMISFIPHPHALSPAPTFQLAGVGAVLDLFENRPRDIVSAYNYGMTEARIGSGITEIGLSVPQILTPELLQ